MLECSICGSFERLQRDCPDKSQAADHGDKDGPFLSCNAQSNVRNISSPSANRVPYACDESSWMFDSHYHTMPDASDEMKHFFLQRGHDVLSYDFNISV
jgi:hypothetical protein